MGDMDFAEIIHELHLIQEKLNLIQRDLNELKRHQQHVKAHVDFVQNVYNRVKRPFFRMMGWADYMTRPRQLTDQEGNFEDATQSRGALAGVDIGNGNVERAVDDATDLHDRDTVRKQGA